MSRIIERSDKSIDEQIKELTAEADRRMGFVESNLNNLFAHVKVDNSVSANITVRSIASDLREVIRTNVIAIMLDVLSHPQRFEMFAALSAQGLPDPAAVTGREAPHGGAHRCEQGMVGADEGRRR